MAQHREKVYNHLISLKEHLKTDVREKLRFSYSCIYNNFLFKANTIILHVWNI